MTALVVAPTAIVECIELADGRIEPLGWPITAVDDYLDVDGCLCVLLRAQHDDRQVPLLVEARHITVTTTPNDNHALRARIQELEAALIEARSETDALVDALANAARKASS